MKGSARKADGASRRIREVAGVLIAALAAGPAATHLYWMLGGTWGLGGQDSSTGIRVVAAVVLLLIIAAMFVVLARVGLWQQAFVSDRVIRFLAWTLAAIFTLETLAAFTWSRGEELWWMYGPVSLVIAALALVVAGSGGAWPHLQRPRRIVSSH